MQLTNEPEALLVGYPRYLMMEMKGEKIGKNLVIPIFVLFGRMARGPTLGVSSNFVWWSETPGLELIK